MHNLVTKKSTGTFGSNNIHEENLAYKIYFLWGCNPSMTSQEGQLQQLNQSDTLLQQTSKIPRVRRQYSEGKSKCGSSTLAPREIATAEELQI